MTTAPSLAVPRLEDLTLAGKRVLVRVDFNCPQDEHGAISTYAAVYLWNQDTSTSNLTPAWDPIKLPDLVIPPVPTEVVPK